jgi:flagellar L-ring protein FlgH
MNLNRSSITYVWRSSIAACALLAGFATAAPAQSLLEAAAGSPEREAAAPAVETDATLDHSMKSPKSAKPAGDHAPVPSAATSTPHYSLFAVVPTKPKVWAKHDLIEIIINKSSLQKFEQTTDLKKNQTLNAQLTRFPSIKSLIEDATLEEGLGSVKPGVGFSNTSNHKGEGKFNRRDQITARVSASVIDVKPNGNLVLEARETVQTDRETSTLVITGTCRSDDITRSNTVLSAQLANMTLRIEHEGDVKDASDKGFIPRMFDAIFNF